ncbi:MAG TPA: aspartate-semialdehyde dehydrogenase [Candidatus Hydrogenedentes bacterium]|nr:aspartate-semialdehyde dehydrogenase [Candidatus Hydrogenedentota bacterium]HQL95810.1 aspartate-semialdehyde dehydrogenase [Candidatus Hydrogenedentota bacterium]HRZ16933.1 aspartate-semialdehyde dehydrogenase [Candidatus Hydrogenedentota bacterium]
MSGKVVAVAGATGVVGREMLRVLEDRNFPVKSIKLLASERSLGKTLKYKGEDIPVEVLSDDSFNGVEIALFSAGGGTSKRFAPSAAKAGCVVVDNSSAWRMDPEVPLVVPEVNPGDIQKHKGIIANPNCSTIQMVVVLKPLHDAARIRRVVVATYQAVSGAGSAALGELAEQTKALVEGRPYPPKIFPHQIAFNVIPQIPQSDAFTANGYTSEEMKMVNETKKIMGDDSIMVTATTVRVPVHTGHSESVNVETEKKLTADQARELLRNAPGVIVQDDPAAQLYPLAVNAAGKYDTFVGRIREDVSHPSALEMWVVADNLLKGAASNAVQIAELL